MSLAEARYHLGKTRQKYVLMRLTEILLQSVSISFFILSLTELLSIKGPTGLLFSLTPALTYFIYQARSLDIFRVTNAGIVNYLNRSYPVMEGGADLMLIEDEQLTSIQQLQKSRAIQQFESLYHSIKLPNKLKVAVILFSTSALIYFVTASSGLIKPDTEISGSTSPVTMMSKSDLAVIKGISVAVTPPAYTNIAPSSTNNFNLRIPEGSLIQWNVDFKGKVTDPKIIFSGNDSLSLTETNSSFRAQRSFSLPAFYQLRWRNNDGSKKSSDYYEIAVIKDQPPAISVENLNQFTEYDFTSNLKTDLRSTIKDDYGLRDAYIIATVSKGSGEAIKFRELKVRFDKPATVSGTSVQVNLVIDLIKLGLEAGDELYFYVEALDNKNPTPNRARTETYFISLRDTSSQATIADPGLGVDLMPEYFRSQRQIIIDSEKLLKERKHITKEAFNSRSNALAHDQKVLRLRYGEFLGEEFESGIGLQTEAHADNEDKDEDVSKQYGHVHDGDNEHNLVDDKKSPTRDSHDHKNDKDKDPLKDYVHAHDSQEEATFFTQSIRAKLKAAITIMWDAELHLRLYDPEKSLPFQYRALKLLKEISQDSRIYVHRTGFDPPPLKEEKRLTGDLAEIKNSKTARESQASQNYPGIRKALLTIDQILALGTITVNPEGKAAIEDAGQELASIAIQRPGRYLRTLSSLKSLSQDELDSAQVLPTLIEIRKVLWNVLPMEIEMPQATSRSSHRLDDQFLNNLERLKQQ